MKVFQDVFTNDEILSDIFPHTLDYNDVIMKVKSQYKKKDDVGKVDIGLMGVFLVLNSSIVSSANFLVTYRYLSTLNNRKRRDARSFFTEGIIVAS